MTELQTLNQENPDVSKPIDFAPRELVLFKAELDKQFSEGNGVDILKALRNARYLAGLERSIKQFDEGKVVKFTAEQWEAFVNGQNLLR